MMMMMMMMMTMTMTMLIIIIIIIVIFISIILIMVTIIVIIHVIIKIIVNITILVVILQEESDSHSKVPVPQLALCIEPRLWSASIGPRWPRWAPRRMAGKLRGCFAMIPSASALGWWCRMRVHGTGEQINIVVKPETNLTCFFLMLSVL